MTQVDAPKNQLVSGINIVLDTLIKGLGVDVAYSLVVAQVPWLALPIVSSIVRWILNSIASSLDTNLKINVDIVVIRYQNDLRKTEYDSAIAKIKQPGASDAEIKAAKAAIDQLVSRTY